MDGLKADIIRSIDRMPEEWDGRQIRQYVEDVVKEQVVWRDMKMTSAEKRKYNEQRRKCRL